jgi:hypothetical protein
MDTERSLEAAFERIKNGALRQRIDFADPANAFTVWADLRHGMQYCGSCPTLDSAWVLAAEHIHLRDMMYIFKGPLDSFGILKYERG